MNIRELVAAIIADVRKRGDRALVVNLKRFDKVSLRPKELRVSRSEIEGAGRRLDPSLASALKKAAGNIRRFHLQEKKNLRLSWTVQSGKARLGQTYSAIERVGVYVPGGRFSYPSTVLMSAIPARVAGVRSIVMVTPPAKLTDAVLYAAKLCGIDEIYRVGGPSAIAALAYGTETVPAVDFIVGPGNAYVNEAKRQVFGQVGIDSLAGPSEVAIIADRSAPLASVVEDLLAQAEHDPMARGYLLTDDQSLAEKAREALPREYGSQVKIITCPLSKAVELANGLAPEHMEIMVKDPAKIIGRVRNAGALFVGADTPTALGDYWAGPSHVLPTGRAARFSSGLSVATFLKRTSFIRFGRGGAGKDSRHVVALANAEGLRHHARSVEVR